MSCNCSDNQERLALLTGRDSVDKLPEDLRRDISQCPSCREHFRALKSSLSALHDSGEINCCHLDQSLWPELSKRLPVTSRAKTRSIWKLNSSHMIPTFSVTAACLAIMVTLANNYQPTQEPVYRTTPVVKGHSIFNNFIDPLEHTNPKGQLYRDGLNRWESEATLPQFIIPELLNEPLLKASPTPGNDQESLYFYHNGQYHQFK